MNIPTVLAGGPDKPLRIGDAKIPCYVLDDEENTRVLSMRGVKSSIGMAQSGGARELTGFVRRIGIKGIKINNLLARMKSPIEFQPPKGRTAYGYPAEVLADLCSVIMDAANKGALTKRQAHFAHHANILMRGFAKVGIISLVDEATGYEKIREENALANILEQFLTDEMRRWNRTFPREFYDHIYRLNNWPEPESPKRPGIIGHWTNDWVYERIAPGLLDELQKRNPKQKSSGRRRNRHHQWFNEESGDPALREHLASVITVMRLSDDITSFKANLDRALPKPDKD